MCSTPRLGPHSSEETSIFATARSRLEPGSEPIPGYRLVARIGQGGSGEVWRGIGPGGFPAALKIIPLSDAEAEAERRSLELLRDIRHANLVTVFGAWQTPGGLIVAMELADGSLWDRYAEAVNAGGRGIPFPELIEYLAEAAKAIDYLNEPRHALPGWGRAGVQHRDIKPHNLLLVGGSVKVADFGLAQVTGERAPTAAVHATPAYASPECFQGQTSAHSDQYSLAVTYCQLRGGRLPFTGGLWQVMLAHSLDVPDLGMLPAPERPVVARALVKHPDDRWPDCRTFVRELANCRRKGPRTSPAGKAGHFSRRFLSPRRRALVAVVALASFFICLGKDHFSRPSAGALAEADEHPALAQADPSMHRERRPVEIPETRGTSEKQVAPDGGPLRDAPGIEPVQTPAPPERPEKVPPNETWDRVPGNLPEEPRPAAEARTSYERGKGLARHGDWDRAIAAFSEALRLDPQCAAAYVERGHAHLWKGECGPAIADYTDALRLDPQLADACYGRGLAHYNQGAYSQAVADYTVALLLKPGYAPALHGRGLALVAQGERERAVADFTAALAADPRHAEAYNSRGCVYCQQGKWDLAAADFARAVQLDGRNASYARNQAFAAARRARSVVIRGLPAPSPVTRNEK